MHTVYHCQHYKDVCLIKIVMAAFEVLSTKLMIHLGLEFMGVQWFYSIVIK